jgi:hypothetical protein
MLNNEREGLSTTRRSTRSSGIFGESDMAALDTGIPKGRIDEERVA